MLTTMLGNDCAASVTRATAVATLPPTKAAPPPRRAPTVAQKATVVTLTTPARRAPTRSTESTSTPLSAVPNGCARDGPARSWARSMACGA